MKDHFLWGAPLLWIVLIFAPAAHADLVDILRRIETDAPALQAAGHRNQAALANVRVARSRYFGSARVFADGTEFDDPRLVGPISPPIALGALKADAEQFGYGATLTLPLDINRRIGAAVDEQARLGDAAGHDVQRVRLVLFGQAVFLLRGLQELAGNRTALLAQQKALQTNQAVVESRIRLGRSPRVEQLRIDAERKAITGQLAALDGRETGLRAALGALMARGAYDGRIDPLGEPPPVLGVGPSSDLIGRPDILAAQSRVAAARARAKGAKREWLPGLGLEAGRLRNQGFATPTNDTWSVALKLNWEFWDGGRRNANIDGAEAAVMAQRSDLDAVRYEAQRELTTALATWRTAQQQFAAAEAGLVAAVETENIQSDRFQAGRISAADLVDAEAALATARATRSSALAQWWLADDQAHIAVGQAPRAYTDAATRPRKARNQP